MHGKKSRESISEESPTAMGILRCVLRLVVELFLNGVRLSLLDECFGFAQDWCVVVGRAITKKS